MIHKIIKRFIFIFEHNLFLIKHLLRISFQNKKNLDGKLPFSFDENDWFKDLLRDKFILNTPFDLSHDDCNFILKYFEQKNRSTVVSKEFFQVYDFDESFVIRIINTLKSKDRYFINKAQYYCGGSLILHSAQFINSVYIQDSFTKSQLFHKDFASSKTFKVFIYLNDVNDLSDGPFIFYPKFKENFFSKLRYGSIHKPIEWEKSNNHVNRINVLGSQGKAFIVDTYNLFHCGSRLSKGKNRKCLILTFRNKEVIRGHTFWGKWKPIDLSINY